MSGVVQAAATDPPGALGRDGVPGGEALAGPGAGDYVLVQHERYTKVVFFLEHSNSSSCFLLLSSFFFFVIFVVCFFLSFLLSLKCTLSDWEPITVILEKNNLDPDLS
jgi:hypothetical protein